MTVGWKAEGKPYGLDLKSCIHIWFSNYVLYIIIYIYICSYWLGSQEGFSWPKDLNLEEIKKIISSMTQTESKSISEAIYFSDWNSVRNFSEFQWCLQSSDRRSWTSQSKTHQGLNCPIFLNFSSVNFAASNGILQ